MSLFSGQNLGKVLQIYPWQDCHYVTDAILFSVGTKYPTAKADLLRNTRLKYPVWIRVGLPRLAPGRRTFGSIISLESSWEWSECKTYFLWIFLPFLLAELFMLIQVQWGALVFLGFVFRFLAGPLSQSLPKNHSCFFFYTALGLLFFDFFLLKCYQLELSEHSRNSYHSGLLYFASIFSTIRRRLPDVMTEKPPHSVMLPPPCLTAGGPLMRRNLSARFPSHMHHKYIKLKTWSAPCTVEFTLSLYVWLNSWCLLCQAQSTAFGVIFGVRYGLCLRCCNLHT